MKVEFIGNSNKFGQQNGEIGTVLLFSLSKDTLLLKIKP